MDNTKHPIAGNWAARGFVAVDWGSSARRAYYLDQQGVIIDQMEDDVGVLTVARHRLRSEVEALRQRFGGAFMLMAGMIGSNRGLIEAPYLACPATLSDIALRLTWAQPGEIAIIPGLSFLDDVHADIMRGEEVQALGLYGMGLAPGRVTICHPGTHTKWIELVGGSVTRFRTVMTGELFSLLKRDSIIAELLQSEVATGPAFISGVKKGIAGGTLGAEIFGARARVLLGAAEAGAAASYVSGLLIGSDVACGLQEYGKHGDIVVLGRESLTRQFAIAIEQYGGVATQIDGAAAFIAGMRAIAERIT